MCCKCLLDSLLALVALWLRDGLLEDHGEVGAAERRLAVVRDQAVQAVEGHRVNQVVLDLTSLLAGPDPAVVYLALAPERKEGNILFNGALNTWRLKGRKEIFYLMTHSTHGA